MAPEIQDDIVRLAERMLDASKAKKLAITWFGGEPLMATDVIEALSARLIRVAEERGCTYEAWIFTNGYLLSEDVVDLLLRCRINNVHIPLDGTETTNDATRRLIGGRLPPSSGSWITSPCSSPHLRRSSVPTRTWAMSVSWTSSSGLCLPAPKRRAPS